MNSKYVECDCSDMTGVLLFQYDLENVTDGGT